MNVSCRNCFEICTEILKEDKRVLWVGEWARVLFVCNGGEQEQVELGGEWIWAEEFIIVVVVAVRARGPEAWCSGGSPLLDLRCLCFAAFVGDFEAGAIYEGPAIEGRNKGNVFCWVILLMVLSDDQVLITMCEMICGIDSYGRVRQLCWWRIQCRS